MKPLDERNQRAKEIVEKGGLWLTYNTGFKRVVITPLRTLKNPGGRLVVEVKAVRGMPFRKRPYEGFPKEATDTTYRFPEDIYELEKE